MHDVCHVEFMSRNVSRLVEFYRDLFGWKKTVDTPTYVILAPKGGPGVGIGTASEGMASPPITNYILVKDIDATLEKVRAQGLEVVHEKTDVPDMGAFGLFKDPDGNVIGLWTALAKRAPRERPAAKKSAKKTAKAAKKPSKKPAKKAGRAKPAAKKARARR